MGICWHNFSCMLRYASNFIPSDNHYIHIRALCTCWYQSMVISYVTVQGKCTCILIIRHMMSIVLSKIGGYCQHSTV